MDPSTTELLNNLCQIGAHPAAGRLRTWVLFIDRCLVKRPVDSIVKFVKGFPLFSGVEVKISRAVLLALLLIGDCRYSEEKFEVGEKPAETAWLFRIKSGSGVVSAGGHVWSGHYKWATEMDGVLEVQSGGKSETVK